MEIQNQNEVSNSFCEEKVLVLTEDVVAIIASLLMIALTNRQELKIGVIVFIGTLILATCLLVKHSKMKHLSNL